MERTMWLLPLLVAAEATTLAVPPGATPPSSEPQTRSRYDSAVCGSSAVFLGTEIGRTCIEEEGHRDTVITFRVERSFEGRLPEEVKVVEPGCPTYYVDESGVAMMMFTPPSHPVSVAPTNVLFLRSTPGAETLASAGFHDVILIPKAVAVGTVAAMGWPRNPAHVVDLAAVPIRTLPIATVSGEPLVASADWNVVLDQLDAVAARQPRDRCVPARGTRRATR
jgi:hypothetical protein